MSQLKLESFPLRYCQDQEQVLESGDETYFPALRVGLQKTSSVVSENVVKHIEAFRFFVTLTDRYIVLACAVILVRLPNWSQFCKGVCSSGK